MRHGLIWLGLSFIVAGLVLFHFSRQEGVMLIVSLVCIALGIICCHRAKVDPESLPNAEDARYTLDHTGDDL